MKYEKFVKDLDKLLKTIEDDPEDLDGFLELGKYYFVNKMYDSAITVYNKGLSCIEAPELYYNVGIAYQANSDPAKAKEMFIKALELDPTYVEAQKSLEEITGF